MRTIVGLLGLLLCTPVAAQQDPGLSGVWQDLHTGGRLSFTALPSRLAQARVVCVGESHPDAAHHRVQLEVVKALHSEGPVGIGLEMLWREQQPHVDRYLAGELDEAAFLQAVDWSNTWGYPWELYAPLFRYAKQHGLAIFGLNAPRELVRQVGRQGIEGLSLAERLKLPVIDLAVPGHRELFERNLGGAHGAHGGEGFERMYQAMTLWDEYMAESAARFCRTTPGTRLVVLAGSGHIGGRHGIPLRIERRLGEPVTVVLPQALDNPEDLPDTSEADVLVHTRPFELADQQAPQGLVVREQGELWFVEHPGNLTALGLLEDDVLVRIEGRAPAAWAGVGVPRNLEVLRAGRRRLLQATGSYR